MTIHEERDLISAPELAAYLDVHIKTLRNWRRDGKGPDFIRIGGRVFYSRPVVQAWIEANKS
ncbi:helix-turn-helix transcriptional regulator [Kribbella solani]|uniref:Putative DNA-binding transcriptional regulator AlpA n=1 Tax=Kribbella solani TaxID=236067 RepID=A0A841DTI5_9ACTN|nr:helix-turn-helix domain-containing protein [Kribbella solani]MBB5982434.1 putative DNA-binding transcriptional regulator AlpA [Kribbella solani]